MKGADLTSHISLPLGVAEENTASSYPICSETIILGDGNDEPTMQLGG